jgi:hypothetical protein
MDTYRRVLDEASESDPATGGEAPRDAEPVSTYSSARQAI